MPPFVLSLLTALLNLVWPGAPAWLGKMFSIALPAVVEIIRELDLRADIPGPARARLAIEEVGKLLDDALDDVPEWRELSEARRDRIIGGLVELALFAERVSARPGGKVDVRAAVRRIREVRPAPGRVPVQPG